MKTEKVHYDVKEKMDILQKEFGVGGLIFNQQIANLLDVMTFDQMKDFAKTILVISKGKIRN